MKYSGIPFTLTGQACTDIFFPFILLSERISRVGIIDASEKKYPGK